MDNVTQESKAQVLWSLSPKGSSKDQKHNLQASSWVRPLGAGSAFYFRNQFFAHEFDFPSNWSFVGELKTDLDVSVSGLEGVERVEGSWSGNVIWTEAFEGHPSGVWQQK